MTTPITEGVARTMLTCPVCGRPKERDAIVCWGECWRGHGGLKYSGLSADEWLAIKAYRLR